MLCFLLMNAKGFKKLFQEHRGKIFEAWNKLSDRDLEGIDGDLDRFIEKVSSIYRIPKRVVLKELDIVQRNIKEGIEEDFGYRLNPEE